jgi:hypothetical protein
MHAEGGCLCTAVRYRFEREAMLSAHHCHCRDCQKCTGSGKATILMLPRPALELTGTLKTFTVIGSAGSHVNRAFCPECGSPILSHVDELPGMVFVKAGSLDDSAWVEIQSSFWGSTAVGWSPTDTTKPLAPGNP